MSARTARGFTLVEVLVALLIVALGLAALMVAVSGASRTSGYLRDKTLAQWIALNRLAEVRLNVNKFGQNTDAGEVKYANRTWHYDTRYFDTSIATMKRVVVRVYAGDAKAKGNPLAESSTFHGDALGIPGSSNTTNWTTGSAQPNAPPANLPGGAGAGTNVAPTTPTNPVNPANPGGATIVPNAGSQ